MNPIPAGDAGRSAMPWIASSPISETSDGAWSSAPTLDPPLTRMMSVSRAQVAREILPDTLRESGAEIDVVPAYKTILPATGKEALEAKLREGSVDVITFTSTSTVKNFMDLIGNDLKAYLAITVIACIGPITAKTAQDLGLKVDIIPKEYTVESLTQALEDHFSIQGKHS